MATLIIHEAYGENSATAKTASILWDEGKDFKILGGPYCSVRDTETISKSYDKIQMLLDTGGRVTVWEGKPIVDKLKGII